MLTKYRKTSLCPCFAGPLFSYPPGASVPMSTIRGLNNAFVTPTRTSSAAIVPAGMKPAGKGFGHLPGKSNRNARHPEMVHRRPALAQASISTPGDP